MHRSSGRGEQAVRSTSSRAASGAPGGQAQVRGHGRVEQEGILISDRDDPWHLRRAEASRVDPVDRDGAGLGVPVALEEARASSTSRIPWVR